MWFEVLVLRLSIRVRIVFIGIQIKEYTFRVAAGLEGVSIVSHAVKLFLNFFAGIF